MRRRATPRARRWGGKQAVQPASICRFSVNQARAGSRAQPASIRRFSANQARAGSRAGRWGDATFFTFWVAAFVPPARVLYAQSILRGYTHPGWPKVSPAPDSTPGMSMSRRP